MRREVRRSPTRSIPRFTPDARLVAIDNDGRAQERPRHRRTTTSGREVYRLRGERCGSFGPDGKHPFTLTADYATANVREAESGKLVRAVPCDGDDSFFFAPDGKVFARPWRQNTQAHAVTGERVFEGKEFLPEHLKPEQFRRRAGAPPEPQDSVRGSALGPGGRRFAVTATRYWDGDDGPPQDRVVVFDAAGKKRLWEAAPEAGRWFGYSRPAAAFSPDGSTLAVGPPDACPVRRGKQLVATTATGGASPTSSLPARESGSSGRRDGTVWVGRRHAVRGGSPSHRFRGRLAGGSGLKRILTCSPGRRSK